MSAKSANFWTPLGADVLFEWSLSIFMTLYPDDVVKIMSWTETTFGLGYSLGPAVGVLIYDLGGFKLPFIVVGVVALILAIALIFLIPGENTDKEVWMHF